jgi:hypothetical protein
MARVREVWVLSIPEQRQGRLLVCKLWDEEGWFEPNRQDEAKTVGEGRHLLARFEVR